MDGEPLLVLKSMTPPSTVKSSPTLTSAVTVKLPLLSNFNPLPDPTVPPDLITKLSLSESSTAMWNLSAPCVSKIIVGSPEATSISKAPLMFKLPPTKALTEG